MSALCFECQKIELQWRPREKCIDYNIVINSDNFDYRKNRTPIRHYATFKDLRLSASKCSFCRLILENMDKSYEHKSGEKYHDRTDISVAYWQRSESAQVDMEFAPRFQVDYTLEGKIVESYIGEFGGLYASRESSAASIVPGRKIMPDPGSQEVHDVIQDWLQCCRTTHPTCPKLDSVALPTRVVDVGPADGSREPLVFVPPSGFRGSYLALSYCWGVSNTDYVLTTATLKDKQSSIPFLTLPRTIQDAIETTRRLTFRFIWIDALCIIQDSKSDWKKEAQTMGSVYSLATMTISAVRAADCREGFLLQRNVSGGYSVPMKLRGPHGDVDEVYLRSRRTEYIEASQPLSSRGWTLQEALLSPRNLQYGQEQLRWECRSAAFLEDSGLAPLTRTEGSESSLAFQSWVASFVVGQEWTKRYTRNTDLRLCWRTIVEGYTDRHLTQESDRLIALAGIVQFAKDVDDGDECLFGIWKYQMPWMLLWSARSGNTPRKPSGCKAPSWSWASVRGLINHPLFEGSFPAYCQITQTWPATGELEIRGVLNVGVITPTKWDKPSEAIVFIRGRLWIPAHGIAPEEHNCKTIFDDRSGMDDLLKAATPLYCLIVVGTLGLVLVATEQKGHFRRVGRYYCSTTPYHEEQIIYKAWDYASEQRAFILA